MTGFSQKSVSVDPALGKGLNGARKGFALGAIAFFTIATSAGALLAASLARTAVTLMRDEPGPTQGEVFEGRVRLKNLDNTADGHRIVAQSRPPLAH